MDRDFLLSSLEQARQTTLEKIAAPIFSAGSLAGTMAGVGAAAGGIKGFYGSNRFDKDVSLDRRVINAGLGGIAGATVGGLAGYGAGKHILKKVPSLGKSIESLQSLPTDEGAVKALKMVGRGAHAAYMNPVVRAGLGYKATKGLHDWYREGVDKYRISQLAGERMKKQTPGFEDGDELGFLMAERGYGDYSKRSGGK